MNADKGSRKAPSANGRHRGDSRRGAAHARTPGRPAIGDPWIGQPDPPRPEPEQSSAHVDDYPSWPGRPGPYALHPDHPSWPGRPDPRWTDTEAALRADDYPSWPDRQIPPRPERLNQSRPERTAPPRPGPTGASRAERQVPPARVPPRTGRRPAPWPDARPPGPGNGGWSAGGSAAPRPAPQAPPAPVRSPRFQAAPTAPTAPVRARTDLAPRAYPAPTQPILRGSVAEVIDRSRPPAAPTWPHPAQPEAGPVWDAGSVQLATWIISEANQHAADIRHEARDEAATSLAGAKQEATQLVRQASDQAAATLEAAELEAAEIRANVTKLTAELGGVAAFVTQSLYAPAAPVTRPVISPENTPEIAPAAAPEALPATPPAAKPAAIPAAKPAHQRAATTPKTAPKATPASTPKSTPRAKPKARQLVAIRVMTVIAATLVLFAVVTGVTEIALHGFAFFVFRSVGTGETAPGGLQENQGPGQPDAPGPSPAHLPTDLHTAQ
jgi:hypothetical protein